MKEGGKNMQSARMMGNYVENLAKRQNISTLHLGQILECTEEQVSSFFKGRFFPAFSQIEALASELKISVEELFNGDEETYNASVVHCMKNFSNTDNRERILDLIDDYLDVKGAVDNQ